MAHESYVEGYLRWRSQQREAAETQRRELLERVRALEEYFDGKPGLRRVYVFGSAATSGCFRPESDLDLATEGLPAEHFCQTLSEIVEQLQRSVDAVRLEDVSSDLRTRIVKGTIVYERRASPDP